MAIGVSTVQVPVPALTMQQAVITSQAACVPVDGQGMHVISVSILMEVTVDWEYVNCVLSIKRVMSHSGDPTVEKYATASPIIAYLAMERQVNASAGQALPESTASKVRVVDCSHAVVALEPFVCTLYSVSNRIFWKQLRRNL